MKPAIPDPGALARAVRECVKAFDQKGSVYNAVRFRKQVEIEAGYPENHLQAYQSIIEEIRAQQNRAISIPDPLQNVYSGRKDSRTKELKLGKAEHDKDLKKRKMASKKGENHSEFYKYRKASTDLVNSIAKSSPKERTPKNKRSRYSQLLGKDTSESLQQRHNRQAEEKKKRGRETNEKRKARAAARNQGAKAGTKPMVTGENNSKPTRFGWCFCFSKTRAIDRVIISGTEGEGEEDDGEEESGEDEAPKTDAALIQHLSNTAPMSW
jgi:hypothetical protein